MKRHPAAEISQSRREAEDHRPDVSQRIADHPEAAKLAANGRGPWTEEKRTSCTQKLAGDYVIFTSPTRLDAVATDFVEHYHQRRSAVPAATARP